MKALVKAHAERGLWLEDVPIPEIGINEVLIRVHKTGICGTDLHIESWDAWAQSDDPGADGRGPRVRRGGRGVRLERHGLQGRATSSAAKGHVVCGRCRNCMAGRRHLCAHSIGLGVQRPGAFAEYVALPMTNIWHHWPGVDEDVASIFDPFGNAVHTALSFPVLGEDVLYQARGRSAVWPPRSYGTQVPATSSSRTSTRTGSISQPDGRDARGRSARARDRGRAARAGYERGLRHRPGDVRQPGAPSGR